MAGFDKSRTLNGVEPLFDVLISVDESAELYQPASRLAFRFNSFSQVARIVQVILVELRSASEGSVGICWRICRTNVRSNEQAERFLRNKAADSGPESAESPWKRHSWTAVYRSRARSYPIIRDAEKGNEFGKSVCLNCLDRKKFLLRTYCDDLNLQSEKDFRPNICAVVLAAS